MQLFVHTLLCSLSITTVADAIPLEDMGEPVIEINELEAPIIFVTPL